MLSYILVAFISFVLQFLIQKRQIVFKYLDEGCALLQISVVVLC